MTGKRPWVGVIEVVVARPPSEIGGLQDTNIQQSNTLYKDLENNSKGRMASSSSNDERDWREENKRDSAESRTLLEQLERDTAESRTLLEEQGRLLEQLEKNTEQLEKNTEQLEKNTEQLEKNTEQLEKNTAESRTLLDTAELKRYEMGESPRGICLLINNIYFPGKKEREGAELDEKEIKELFKKELHFEMKIERNLGGLAILNAAREIAKKDHSKYTAFVFIIMSHGGEKDAILGLDGRKARLEDLMSEFTATNCPSLQGKPKLFFIQACRGKGEDRRRDRLLPSPDSIEDDSPDCIVPFADSTLAAGVLPEQADFLLAFATVPRYKSFRSKVKGSWFIQILVDVIRKHHHRHHLLDMLTEVSRQVAEIANKCPDVDLSFQVPASTHTLNAQVFL